jgi:hypothetical protein
MKFGSQSMDQIEVYTTHQNALGAFVKINI